MDPIENGRTVVIERWRTVMERIAAAAQRAGRSPGDVKLVAVSKWQPAAAVATLAAAGQADFGENYPQELASKAAASPLAGITWHLIGHLQRNKVALSVPSAGLIHSADSERLLVALDTAGKAAGRKVRLLLEVNQTGAPTRHGFVPDQVAVLGGLLRQLGHVRVEGLMAMAEPGPEGECQAVFAAVRELRDRLRAEWGPAEFPLPELSMGMTNDFEVAIAEGATLVRIGTAIFGPRPGGAAGGG
jgi:pyridoxal phosphate enzyme (YggS family)